MWRTSPQRLQSYGRLMKGGLSFFAPFLMAILIKNRHEQEPRKECQLMFLKSWF